MALAAPQQIAIPGIIPAYATPLTTETTTPNARLFLHVKIGGTATTVVVQSPAQMDQFGQTFPDITTGSITSTERMIGPIPGNLADLTTGLVTVTFSQTTSVTGAWFLL